MDRRTHHRLAQPLPPLGQGLGVPQPKGLGVLAPRLNPPHAEKALSKKSMIPDRLSVTFFSASSSPDEARLSAFKASTWSLLLSSSILMALCCSSQALKPQFPP